MNTKLRLELLEYLEAWSDSSLENMVLIYTGQAKDVDLSKLHDSKVHKLFTIIRKLREMRRYEDLEELYDEIARICQR